VSADPLNRLAAASSPYLRQHAHNPVDWYPWGPEAHERAKSLDRPIFLSVGYAACHWCHVMEHESFLDQSTADFLNAHFVNIKVDREERPDIDHVYMSAVQAMTGQGGWPLSVFLTPDLKPFFGGTYFPPRDYYGRPSFRRVLETITQWWQDKRRDINEFAASLIEELARRERWSHEEGNLNADLLAQAGRSFCAILDRRHGGFGSAPKFPHALEISLLLRFWKRFQDQEYLRAATLTLEWMARGGIHDQLGGGFHRYSTDDRWLVPHFEKMLYDNALLARAYVAAYQVTGESFFAETARSVLDYALGEMRAPGGGFYSSQDADSEGQEGKFYVWTAPQIRAALKPELAELAILAFDITEEGNWEGQNILTRAKGNAEIASRLGVDEAGLEEKLGQVRRQLYQIRADRVHPARDEKVLTGWNGLMIQALAEAARPLGEHDYLEAANRAATAVLAGAQAPHGGWLRTGELGYQPAVPGFLDDYAYFINGLISLYEASGRVTWLSAALELTESMILRFGNEDTGAFSFTGQENESLPVRNFDMADSSVPSPNAVAVECLLRLSKLLGRQRFWDYAETALRRSQGLMRRSPMAAAQMLHALDFYLGPVEEITLVGSTTAPEREQGLDAVYRAYEPNRIVVTSPEPGETTHLDLPLLRDRPPRNGLTAYICRGQSCLEPIVGIEALARVLVVRTPRAALSKP
jgi:uncharacterized protein YyaL (SSP411 family)